MKKRGFGEGKRNGAGWKQHEGETIEQTAIREFQEETWVIIDTENLKKYWVLHFSRPHKAAWNQDVHVFVGETYSGIPTESDEMKPQWRDIDAIPYGSMRADDTIWLPRLLAQEQFEYEFVFNENNEIYHSNVIQ